MKYLLGGCEIDCSPISVTPILGFKILYAACLITDDAVPKIYCAVTATL